MLRAGSGDGSGVPCVLLCGVFGAGLWDTGRAGEGVVSRERTEFAVCLQSAAPRPST